MGILSSSNDEPKHEPSKGQIQRAEHGSAHEPKVLVKNVKKKLKILRKKMELVAQQVTSMSRARVAQLGSTQLPSLDLDVNLSLY